MHVNSYCHSHASAGVFHKNQKSKRKPNTNKVSQYVNRDAADAQTKPEINENVRRSAAWMKHEMRSRLMQLDQILTFPSNQGCLKIKIKEKRLTNATNSFFTAYSSIKVIFFTPNLKTRLIYTEDECNKPDIFRFKLPSSTLKNILSNRSFPNLRK